MPNWVQPLSASTQEFARVLAQGDLDAAVPACPGWSLADLGEHLGGVHQWAAHAITHATPDGEPTPAPRDRDGLVSWYARSAADLITVLTRTPPDAPAWHFGPKPRTAGFWGRRQVHETQMHLWDAHASQGNTWGLDAALALDGLDEVLTVFVPRQVRLGRMPPLAAALALVPVDDVRVDAGQPGGARFVLAGPADGDPAATVHGPPGALLLLVWKRIGLDDVGLQVTGDRAAAEAVLSQALTP